MSHPFRIFTGLFLAVLLAGPRHSQAATTIAASPPKSIYLDKMLSSRISLNLKTCTLRRAFSTLADTAHIPIDVQQRAYELLPLGDRTLISAQFQSVSVRSAMQTIVGQLALRIRIARGRLVIMPSTALRRIGRRATWGELNMLRTLQHLIITRVNGDWPARLRPQLQQAPPPSRLPMVAPALQAQALAAVRRQLPATAAQALSTYSRALHRIWYVHHDRLLITTRKSWVRRQLHRPVFLHVSNAPLQMVLAKLSRSTGVRFVPAAGLYIAIPTVNVASNGGSAAQTLDALGGGTGMTWHIRGAHVVLAPPRPLTVTGPERDNPIVGIIRIPISGGIHLNLFLRKSQLPASLQKQLGTRLQQDIDLLEKNFAPLQTPSHRKGK